MPTIQQLADALHTQLQQSTLCDRKGDVAAQAIVLAGQYGLTSPNFSTFTNTGTTTPEVPEIKDPPDDPDDLEKAVRLGYQMLACYLGCLGSPDPQLCVDGCEATYCEGMAGI